MPACCVQTRLSEHETALSVEEFTAVLTQTLPAFLLLDLTVFRILALSWHHVPEDPDPRALKNKLISIELESVIKHT